MKITIYELIKLVIDGKAPRQIKYSNRIYDYNEKQEDYECFIENHYDYLLDNTNTFRQFNDEVEVEEDKDIEDIEELTDDDIYFYPECEDESKENFKNKINELVREVNKLKNK